MQNTRDIIINSKYLTNLIFLVHTVSYGFLLFPLRFMAQARRVRAINLSRKNAVRNLQYRPQTRLVRGISGSYTLVIFTTVLQ